MIKFDSFVKALKVTLFRRHIIQINCSLGSLLNIEIDSLLSKKGNYAHLKNK